MRREFHAVVLLLLGGVLLRLTITGEYVNYVRSGLAPVLLAAAAVLLLVAGATLWRAFGGSETRDHHAHGHGRFDVAWLLLLPVLGLLITAPPALGSYSASRSGTVLGTAQPERRLPPLPDGDPVRLSILEYASRAVVDDGRSLADRHLTMSGFLLPGADGGWYLARLVVVCCAADARPVKIGLTGILPDGLHANDWLQVTGRFAPDTERDPVNGEPIPYLQVAAANPIPVPAEPYAS
ncbi:MAG: TIGR03943 family protein [Dactylosporangium sp.]|nr:TIGR03943 family protein [Dactylosporangium sp.]NNJ62814.1 TIGR03943 family protein [Dactylosporangium sp.]